MQNERFFPPGSIIIRPKDMPGVEIALYGNDPHGRCNALGYYGRKIKPSFRYRFRSLSEREQHIQQFLVDCQKLYEARAVRGESRNRSRKLEVNPVKVGDMFVSSWGYEQTNVDFYKVVAVRGSSVEIVPMETKIDRYVGDMSEYVLPDTAPAGPRMTKRVQTHDSGKTVYLKMTTYSQAQLWDGQPQYCSHYA